MQGRLSDVAYPPYWHHEGLKCSLFSVSANFRLSIISLFMVMRSFAYEIPSCNNEFFRSDSDRLLITLSRMWLNATMESALVKQFWMLVDRNTGEKQGESLTEKWCSQCHYHSVLYHTVLLNALQDVPSVYWFTSTAVKLYCCNKRNIED